MTSIAAQRRLYLIRKNRPLTETLLQCYSTGVLAASHAFLPLLWLFPSRANDITACVSQCRLLFAALLPQRALGPALQLSGPLSMDFGPVFDDFNVESASSETPSSTSDAPPPPLVQLHISSTVDDLQALMERSQTVARRHAIVWRPCGPVIQQLGGGIHIVQQAHPTCQRQGVGGALWLWKVWEESMANHVHLVCQDGRW